MSGEFPTIEAMRTGLSDPDPERRWAALDAARHALPPEEALPLLVSAARDADASVRGLAVHACHEMAWNPDLIPLLAGRISTFSALLGDESSAVALEAISLLQLLGPDARPAGPALARLRSHPDDEVREAAAEALGLIGDG